MLRGSDKFFANLTSTGVPPCLSVLPRSWQPRTTPPAKMAMSLFGHWSLSAYLKYRVQRAVAFIGAFEDWHFDWLDVPALIRGADAVLEALDKPSSLKTIVPDRPGHDRRYALETRRLRALGWTPQIPFERGLRETVDWYRANRSWWEPIKSGSFREYYQRQYEQRLAEAAP